MQVNESNPMTGIDGRATLISNLSKALRTNSTFFGPEGRPGNLIGQKTFIAPIYVTEVSQLHRVRLS